MMPERRVRPFAAACFVTILGNTLGCSVAVKPPPPPPMSMPDVGDEPPEPEPSTSRVVISTDVPASVSYLPAGTTLELPLCDATPCSATLPYGDYVLAFKGLRDSERQSRAPIRVMRPDEVVNHTLGKRPASPLAAVGVIIGLAGALTLALAFAVAADGNDRGSKPDRSLAEVAGVGLGATLFGGTLFLAAPRYRQEGSTTHWAPIPKDASIGAGFRF
jgi:hypothetical protein